MQIKKRILTTIGVLLALILLLLGGLVAPSVFAIQDLTTRIGEERARLDTQYALRIFMRDAEAKMTEVTSRLANISSMSIEEGGELEFITALENAAATNGVEQQIILATANQMDTSAWEREIPLTLSINGPYPNTLRHLAAIEKLPYEVVVSAVEIIPSRRHGTVNPEGRIELTVSAVVRWRSLSAPAFVRGLPKTN